MSSDSFDLALLSGLGADGAITVQKFTIYLPDRDKNQNPIPNIEEYIEAGASLLAGINHGVTRLPAAQGMWINSETGIPVTENTVLLYSFIRQPEQFIQRLPEIREFLHEFGSSTNQGEVVVEYFGETLDGRLYSRAYWITKFTSLD